MRSMSPSWATARRSAAAGSLYDSAPPSNGSDPASRDEADVSSGGCDAPWDVPPGLILGPRAFSLVLEGHSGRHAASEWNEMKSIVVENDQKEQFLLCLVGP